MATETTLSVHCLMFTISDDGELQQMFMPFVVKTPLNSSVETISTYIYPDSDPSKLKSNVLLWKLTKPIEYSGLRAAIESPGFAHSSYLLGSRPLDSGNTFNVGDVNLQFLQPMQNLSDYKWSSDSLLEEPYVEVMVIRNRNESLQSHQIPSSTDLFMQDVSFAIPSRESNQFHEDDLGENEVYRTHDSPDFVTKYREELKKPRFSPSPVQEWLAALNYNLRSTSPTPTFFKNDGRPLEPGSPELAHLAYLSFLMDPLTKTGRLKASKFAECSFFVPLETFCVKHSQDVVCTFDQTIPFILYADNVSHRYTYEPRIDFSLLKHVPRLLVEIDSAVKEIDKFRILVTGACAVRLANTYLRTQRKKPEFVLMCVFLMDGGGIQRFFLFQKRDISPRAVYYTEDTFNMLKPVDNVQFMFELYNLVAKIKGDETFKGMESVFSKVTADVRKRGGEVLTTLRDAKRHRTGGDSGTDRRTIESAGFVLQKVPGGDFKPLVKLPSHIFRATDAHGRAVVLKKVRESSNETSLLQELSALHSPKNHMIPLLQVIDSESGTFIVLPDELPLSAFTFTHRKDRLRGRIAELSRELVEGVAFLHEHGIAHLDLKPDNLTVSDGGEGTLHIIDFDIAVRCADVNEMVDYECGTPSWTAPEVRRGLAYNPIRADLWACGRILLHFYDATREHDPKSILLARQLLNRDPQSRPLLHTRSGDDIDMQASG